MQSSLKSFFIDLLQFTVNSKLKKGNVGRGHIRGNLLPFSIFSKIKMRSLLFIQFKLYIYIYIYILVYFTAWLVDSHKRAPFFFFLFLHSHRTGRTFAQLHIAQQHKLHSCALHSSTLHTTQPTVIGQHVFLLYQLL